MHHFNLADFNAISVSLGNGDDQFTEQPGVLADKPLTVDGGNGNDTIKTGDGIDMIFGGNGDDSVDAGRGNDSVFLGNGKDFFVWNPGQGSDAVDGGNGNEDVMQFNGANVNETMSLSANGIQGGVPARCGRHPHGHERHRDLQSQGARWRRQRHGQQPRRHVGP